MLFFFFLALMEPERDSVLPESAAPGVWGVGGVERGGSSAASCHSTLQRGGMMLGSSGMETLHSARPISRVWPRRRNRRVRARSLRPLRPPDCI